MNEPLVPVFIPPLATLLANATRKKGARLTEAEVIAIRDAGICMMLSREHADAMTAQRGYRDVSPENCWADWQRLRVELTGDGCLPKLVLCVLGGDDAAKGIVVALEQLHMKFELHYPDGRMKKAFEKSQSGLRPSLGPEELAQIAEHKTVVYVLSDNYTAKDARRVAQRSLALIATMFGAGAIAIKCESSGIAHSRERWMEHARRGALFEAFVQQPLGDRADYYTCGMHLLGKPDVIVSRSLVSGARDAAELFTGFSLYLLDECADGAFGSGNTFRLTRDSPRFQVTWEPCTGYDEDDFFFNPFGRWRFGPCVT